MPSDNAEYVRCFGCFIKENSVDWMTRRELSQAIPPAYTRVHRPPAHRDGRRCLIPISPLIGDE